MSEFDEAQRELKPPGVPGWWADVLPQLSDERLADLMDAAVNPQISHRAISVVLQRWGYPISRERVAHWRQNHV